MEIWNTENKIDSKHNFQKVIEEYYKRIAENRIPPQLLLDIINKVTDKIYSDYERFWNQYPKSRKRYSKLRLDDLEHPYIYYLITDYLKLEDKLNYREFSKLLLKMNDEEFDSYEIRKHQYETK